MSQHALPKETLTSAYERTMTVIMTAYAILCHLLPPSQIIYRTMMTMTLTMITPPGTNTAVIQPFLQIDRRLDHSRAAIIKMAKHALSNAYTAAYRRQATTILNIASSLNCQNHRLH
jgi:hypothetical protein